jgi:hypothetical protein
VRQFKKMGSIQAAEPRISGALVFDGYRAFGHLDLPPPYRIQVVTCVWIKNNQLASAKRIYNVRVRIEYFHDCAKEFNIQSAQWVIRATQTSTDWSECIDLDPNESQCVPIFMQPKLLCTLDPLWPQSGLDEFRKPRPLRPGRWLTRITVSADGVEPLVGEIEFTIYQESKDAPLAIGTQPPLGDVRLPLMPTQPIKNTGNLRSLWDWIGGRWGWPALLGTGIAIIKAGEYALGGALLCLSAVAAVSKISHWRPAIGSRWPRQLLGYFLVLSGLAAGVLITLQMKGGDPWSHLSPHGTKAATTAEVPPIQSAAAPVTSPPSPKHTDSRTSPRRQAAAVLNCPNGICTSNGTIINPTVNNFGEIKQVPKFTFTVQDIPPKDGDGADAKRLSVSVFTDRAIPGAVIGLLLSKPAKIDGLVGITYGIPFSSHPMALIDAEGKPVPNGVAVPLDLPAAFLPGQQLIISLLTTKGAEVQKVLNVVPH